MVMEAPPSPQSVGREFVWQYYTLLNMEPNHVHRFYNNQSSFVHGGLDPNRETSPVIGQKQIHQKIQQLNFHDCHAKITQVDSQATLGGGVVVQVTGELSNAGQPMRRFTQTFVLAAQSPKKYYVHNDIFRYQDEIITDEECDQPERSEAPLDVIEEPQQREFQVIQPGEAPQQPMPFFNANSGPPAQHIQAAVVTGPPHVLTQQTVNGSVHPDDINTFPGGGAGVPAHVVMQPNMIIEPSMKLDDSEGDQNDSTGSQGGVVVQTSHDEHPEQFQERSEYSEPSNEPKTYANLLKSSPFNSPPQIVSNNPVSYPVPRSTSPVTSSNVPATYNHNRNRSNNRVASNNNTGPGNVRVPRQDSLRPVKNSNCEESGGDERRIRNQSNNYATDFNQLFLGNLPLNVNEDDLREIFIEFGAILDLKVHSKSGKTGVPPPGSRPTPNYGFITFETYQGMQNCLSARPIFYPKGDKSGTLLNVEEKKMKDRQSFGGRMNNDRERNRDKRGGHNGLNRNSTNSGGGNGGAGTLPGGPRPNNYNRNGGNNNRGGSNNNTYNNRR